MRPAIDQRGESTYFGRIGIAAMLLAVLFGRAVYVALPVNSDTAMFVYAGKLVAEGGRPGVDLLDNKLPTVGLLMSLPWRFLHGHWPAYAILGLLLSVVASAMLWRTAKLLWGDAAGRAVLVASVVWLNFPPAVFGQFQLETIHVCLASIAGATTLRLLRKPDWRDALLVGLCAGLAAWAKPTGLAVVGAAILAILITRPPRWFSTLYWLTIGTLGPLCVAGWLVLLCGMADALPATVRQLQDYAAGSTHTAMDVAKPLIVLGVLAFPLLILGGVFRRERIESSATRGDAVFVVVWLLTELIGVVMQRRMYAYHFLPLGPPAALAVGLLARRFSTRSLMMAFGPIVAASVLCSAGLWRTRNDDTRAERVIAYLETHAGPNDAIWADDYPRLLVETGRRPGSAVPMIFLMANGDAAPDFFGRRILADLAERRPAYVVFATDPARLADLYRHHMADVASSPVRADGMARQIDAIADFLRANYRPEAEIDGLTIWHR